MSGFAVNRKEMNRGCGERSGRWTFEEFMFTESTFGSAVVEYEFLWTPPHRADDALFAPGMNFGTFEVFSPVVKEIVVFDDDGNSIPLTPAAEEECRKIVLDAFEMIHGDVQEFEGDLRC